MKCYALTPQQMANAMLGMENKTMIRWTDIAKNASFDIHRNTHTASWDLEPIIKRVKNNNNHIAEVLK